MSSAARAAGATAARLTGSSKDAAGRAFGSGIAAAGAVASGIDVSVSVAATAVRQWAFHLGTTKAAIAVAAPRARQVRLIRRARTAALRWRARKARNSRTSVVPPRGRELGIGTSTVLSSVADDRMVIFRLLISVAPPVGPQAP